MARLAAAIPKCGRHFHCLPIHSSCHLWHRKDYTPLNPQSSLCPCDLFCPMNTCITSEWKYLRVSVQLFIFPSSCYSNYWLSRWWHLNQPRSLMYRPLVMGNWHVIWKRNLLYFCHWRLGDFCYRLNWDYRTNTPWQGSTFPPCVPQREKLVFSCSH